MRVVMAALLWMILLLSAGPAAVWGAEARCNELGTNCVCSEPLNTATYTATSWSGGACTSANGCYFNPSDSTTKECSYETQNAPVATYSDYHGSNDATALAALPTGNTVQRFGARDSQAGTWWIGSELNVQALGATFNARMAKRFYAYHGPNYNFRDEAGAQCHAKFLQGTPGAWHFEIAYGDMHMYEFFGTNWGPASAFPRDCCFGVPGAARAMQKSDWKGRWWFVEVVTINRSGPGWRTIVYMRDVTRGVAQINGGVEFVAADTFGTSNSVPQPWTTSFNTVITSNPRQLTMKINGYRETPNSDGITGIAYGQPGSTPGTFGQCLGLRGFSHVLDAGWDTDAGQRIGAAREVESGGAPPPTLPGTPTGVNVTWLEYLLGAITLVAPAGLVALRKRVAR